MAKEVLIIGGGFAGAVAALYLQKNGLVPRIWEAGAPGTTLCGQGISKQTIDHLGDVFDATQFIDTSFQGARWVFPGLTAKVHQECYTMAREHWIPAMLDAARDRGATIEFSRRIKPTEILEWQREHPEGTILGCDGPGSKTRDMVPGAKVSMRLGLQVQVPIEDDFSWLEFCTNKRYSNEYAWAFARKDWVNVGLLGESDSYDKQRLNMWLEHLGYQGKKPKIDAFPIPYNGTKDGTTDGKVLLLGDAAGITNPVTKGGMAAAIYSAEIAAALVARGKAKQYPAVIARHPLRSPSFAKAVTYLRSLDNLTIEKITKPVGGQIELGGANGITPKQAMAIGGKIAVRRPWLAAKAKTFYDAARLSARWSW